MSKASRILGSLCLYVAVMSSAAVGSRDHPAIAAGRDEASLRGSPGTSSSVPASSSAVPACLDAAYQLHGIDFGPYQHGQDPNVNPDVSPAQIRARMEIVAPCTQWVRTFSVTHGLEAAGAIAHSLGLRIAAGAWLSKDLQQNQREIANLISLGQSGQADMLIVGSEALLRNDVTNTQLVSYITQVKQAVPNLPVATADIHSVLLVHPSVIAASDVVLVNYYPYWAGISLDQAMFTINTWHQLVTAVAGGKPVIVSETGWPSQGNTIGGAVPSPGNAAAFFLNFVSWARATHVDYFYFEAFDEPWKARYEGPQGAHWGILDEDGQLKPGFERVFNDETLPNNWDCAGVVGGAGTPSIDLTFVPPYGSALSLAGNVSHVSPDAFAVVVYLSINGGATWYVKPFYNQPLTYTRCDGTWTTNVATGGSDQQATNYAAFLIPRTYTPPALSGQPLPNELFQNAAANTAVSRSTNSVSGTVQDQLGAPLDGVTVTLSGSENQAVATVGGRYSFYRLTTNGPLTVVPSSPGFTFTPTQQVLPTATGAQTAAFVGTTNAELSVAMTATPSGVVAIGDTLTYRILVSNAGPGPATSVSLTETLPSGLSLLSVSTDAGACSGTQPVTCAIGALPRSGSAIVTVAVRATNTGTFVNLVAAAGAERDSNPGDNTASLTTIVTTPLSVTSFIANAAFPVVAGTPVTWTATATGGVAPYTYQFFVFDGASWSVGQAWSPSHTWTWTPPAAGSYSLQVWARSAGSTTPFDGWRAAGAVVSAPTVLTATSVTPSVSTTAAGSPVTWTAYAAGGTGPYTYRFLQFDGTEWTAGQEWSASNRWTWTPPAAGTYRFQVWVRDVGSLAPYDAWRAFGPFTSTRPSVVVISNITADPAPPTPAGTPVTWTATVAGGTGPYTHRFYVYDGSSWTLGQDWSSASAWTWIPPGPGSYWVQAWVRNAGSATPYDAWLGAGPHAVGANAPLEVTSLLPDRAFPVAAGTPVTWVARARGGSGPYHYKFYVYNGSTWSVGQDWSAVDRWTWTPPGSGTYVLQVWVRNSGSVTPYDAWLGAGPVSVSGPVPLSVTNVATRPGAPLVVGGPATITATASGGTGPYTYRFYVYNGSTWTIGQDWSSAHTYAWTPPTTGAYVFQVWVRNAGSAAVYDAWGALGPITVVP